MKIDDNGVVRDMTEAETKEMNQMQEGIEPPLDTPTPEDRIAALEQTSLEQDSALMELADMLGMLMGGV